MIIKCISNSQYDLPKDLLQDCLNENPEYAIKKNQLFVVYGMIIHYDYIWYFFDDQLRNYPMWYPSPLFELVDQRLSKFWIYNFQKGPNKFETVNFWSFPEWANNLYEFYDALVENFATETAIYQRYKTLMDLEYPNPSISTRATQLEDNWLMCPTCIDAWQTESKSGMVICPKCKMVMHNPNYNEKSVS